MGREDIYTVRMSEVGCHCSGNRPRTSYMLCRKKYFCEIINDISEYQFIYFFEFKVSKRIGIKCCWFLCNFIEKKIISSPSFRTGIAERVSENFGDLRKYLFLAHYLSFLNIHHNLLPESESPCTCEF